MEWTRHAAEVVRERGAEGERLLVCRPRVRRVALTIESVCERERERECVCVRVCVCVRERERERERVCVCLR